MKLAFISDIHANLPALQAVLEDIKKHNPDDIYCLGDLINFGGWDNEVIDLIRKRGITSIQGNHDEGIGYQQPFPFSFKTEEQHQFGLLSINHVNKTIRDENREFIRTLPFSIKLEFHFPFHNLKLVLVHGSPISNKEYVSSDTADDKLLELLDEANADVLLMGHTHIPFHRTIYTESENQKIYKHAINAGSVGKPNQGDTKSCYLLLFINDSVELTDPKSVTAEFHFINYDTEAVIRHIRIAGLPGTYDHYLRKGD